MKHPRETFIKTPFLEEKPCYFFIMEIISVITIAEASIDHPISINHPNATPGTMFFLLSVARIELPKVFIPVIKSAF